MIVLDADWIGAVPQEEDLLGYVGENEVEERTFVLSGTDYQDWAFRLDIVLPDRGTDIVLLEPSIVGGNIHLLWKVLNRHLPKQGCLGANIRATKGTRIKKSNMLHFRVLRSVSAVEGTAINPSEIEQAETRMDTKLASANTAANTAGAKAAESSASAAQAAADSSAASAKAAAAGTSESNAKASEIAAKASEDKSKVSETNSKTSETKSSQALSDLLKMIGVDIATLVGGKIPVEQIPSIATTEIYQADSLATMNLLVVQNGDICIRTDENKSYIYNNGWVHLSSPTDYASRAGHAETATTAENATMINNHRMAEMSQADFDVAVKDPNTYYLVK